MCQEYRLSTDIASIVDDLDGLRIGLTLPEGVPAMPERANVRINDAAPILRIARQETCKSELVRRRWSWPTRWGQAIHSFAVEGHDFTSQRCLILVDGLYELAAPEIGQRSATKYLKTMVGHRWFGVAGIWRHHPSTGEAFAMLTSGPGDPFTPRKREVVVLPSDYWRDWLDPAISAKAIFAKLPHSELEEAPISSALN